MESVRAVEVKSWLRLTPVSRPQKLDWQPMDGSTWSNWKDCKEILINDTKIESGVPSQVTEPVMVLPVGCDELGHL